LAEALICGRLNKRPLTIQSAIDSRNDKNMGLIALLSLTALGLTG